MTTLETVVSAIDTALTGASGLSSYTPIVIEVVRKPEDLSTTTFRRYLIEIYGSGITEERRIGGWIRRRFYVEIRCYMKTPEKASTRLFGTSSVSGIHELTQAVHDILLGNRLSNLLDPSASSEVDNISFVDNDNTALTSSVCQWQGVKDERA